VLVARDRHGETSDCILNGTSAEQIGEALTPLLNKHVILCTDGMPATNRLPDTQKSYIAQSILPLVTSYQQYLSYSERQCL
jgi:hypothetical protein